MTPDLAREVAAAKSSLAAAGFAVLSETLNADGGVCLWLDRHGITRVECYEGRSVVSPEPGVGWLWEIAAWDVEGPMAMADLKAVFPRPRDDS